MEALLSTRSPSLPLNSLVKVHPRHVTLNDSGGIDCVLCIGPNECASGKNNYGIPFAIE